MHLQGFATFHMHHAYPIVSAEHCRATCPVSARGLRDSSSWRIVSNGLAITPKKNLADESSASMASNLRAKEMSARSV